MINKYNFIAINKAYKKIIKNKVIKKNVKKKKKIVISMIPYPSGNLHIGHARNYIINDIICRYNKKIGFISNMHFGWDSFGLPTENASINKGISPKKWTKKNIKKMKEQLKNMNIDINWKYEVNTSLPEFYKFSQFFFIKLFEKGYIYKSNYVANWDPIDKTILANEQVINNKGWRSNSKVKKILISSYFIKVKPVIKDILKKNKKNNNWPNYIIESQNNWIGVKYFYFLSFINKKKNEKINIFFKRKTIFSKNIIFISSINNKIVNNFVKTKVLEKFLNNKKKNIKKTKILIKIKTKNLFLKGFLYIKKKFLYDEIFILESKINKVFIIKKKKILFKKKPLFKIKDWCISRQRYWGTPIPIINCKKCGLILNKKIPVILPIYKKPLSLSKDREFYKIKCPKCNKKAKKETDTLDTFFDSSWYFYNFILKENMNNFNFKKLEQIDLYIGGKEHAILHLLYARIFIKLLYKCNISNITEPFKNLLMQGMVLKKINYKGKKIIKKMSKSDGGNIDPDSLIKKYGADSFRMSLMFSCSPKKDFIWDENLIIGCNKFIKKIWNLFFKIKLTMPNNKIKTNDILTLKNKIINSYKKQKFNKVISFCMEYYNKIFSYRNKKNILKDYLIILVFLKPICPGFTSVLKHFIRYYIKKIKEKDIFTKINKIYPKIVLQINGKKKCVFTKKTNIEFYKLKFIKKYNLSKLIKKCIYVKNKVINLVI